MANVYYDELSSALVVVDQRFSLDELKEWGASGIGPHGVIRRICQRGRFNPSEETLREIYAALRHAAQFEHLPVLVSDRYGDRW